MGACLGKSEEADNGPSGFEVGGDSKKNAQSVHSVILRHRNIDVYKKYETKEVLGQGSMGSVSRVQVREGQEGGSAFNPKVKKGMTRQSSNVSLSERRAHKVDYALKQIQLDKVSSAFLEELHNEIDILKAMDHPNIVKAHEVYNHKKQIYIILELCDGGDLYTRLPYSEMEAGYISGKLLSAIKYMHDHGIVHRDLKFENIIFESPHPKAEIKVIDFGLSKKFGNQATGVMHEGVGTLYSMSPQVLQGVYTSQADLWSAGVIIYMLLSSHRPFYSKKRKVMIDKIMRCDYNFNKSYWDPISNEAKDMIDNLLVIDPKKRMDATKALKHVWLSKEFKLSDRKPDQTTADAVQGNLMNYKDVHALKKIALNVIAHKSSTDDILELRKCFDQYDVANNGTISYDEFMTALKEKNYPEERVKEIFNSMDVNKNGVIMYTEFIAATLEAQGHIEEERIAEAFDRLDSDDSGFISRQNLTEFLGHEATSQDIQDLINEIDKDGDGEISYAEFLSMFRQNRTNLFDIIEPAESVYSEDGLLGLDAKIPGGKFDSSRSGA
ncbi:unnamed protein product [Cylindrotheca closterium]|uniref:Calmodulin n=1 Tax=Cylindrotheca closterium TaxID=2856 RepID=A0AAD2CPP1_9STRA|nr:unnamed protein product [Cylindrotheca closterium]